MLGLIRPGLKLSGLNLPGLNLPGVEQPELVGLHWWPTLEGQSSWLELEGLS